MELSLRKPIMLFLIIIAVIGLLYWVYIILSNTIPNLLGESQADRERQELGVNRDLPFYDEFVNSYRECKLSLSAECYCEISYPKTPELYIMEIVNRDKATAIRVHSGAEVDEAAFFGTNSIEQVEFSSGVTTKTTPIDAPDTTYFKNSGLSYPIQEGGKLNILDFTPVERQFVEEDTIYSATDVSGSDEINVESGIALYKFSNEKSALVPKATTTGLKKCEKLEGATIASEEFDKLLSIVNKCLETNVRDECKYTTAVLKTIADFSINLKNNKFVLNYKDEEVKSQQLTKTPCGFSDYRNTAQADQQPLSTLNFNDYVEIDFYPFENNLCLLPVTLEQAQQRRIAEERGRLGLNPPLIPTGSAKCDAGVIGDSITASGIYVQRLNSLCGSQLFNEYGIEGQGTAAMSARFDVDITSKNYKDVIIQGGINNIAGPEQDIKDNLAEMYLKGKQNNMRVIALTLTPCGGYQSSTVTCNQYTQNKIISINNWILTEAENVDMSVNIYAALNNGAGALKPEFDSGDHLHPNAAGQNIIAEAIYQSAYSNNECQQLLCIS